MLWLVSLMLLLLLLFPAAEFFHLVVHLLFRTVLAFVVAVVEFGFISVVRVASVVHMMPFCLPHIWLVATAAAPLPRPAVVLLPVVLLGMLLRGCTTVSPTIPGVVVAIHVHVFVGVIVINTPAVDVCRRFTHRPCRPPITAPSHLPMIHMIGIVWALETLTATTACISTATAEQHTCHTVIPLLCNALAFSWTCCTRATTAVVVVTVLARLPACQRGNAHAGGAARTATNQTTSTQTHQSRATKESYYAIRCSVKQMQTNEHTNRLKMRQSNKQVLFNQSRRLVSFTNQHNGGPRPFTVLQAQPPACVVRH